MHFLIMRVHGEHAGKVQITESALFYCMIVANMEAHDPDVSICGYSTEPQSFDSPICCLDYVVKVRLYSRLGGEIAKKIDET